MQHILLMIVGLVVGISLGRHDAWFWGIAFGFVLAELIRLGTRIRSLERNLQLLRQPEQQASGVELSKPVEPVMQPDVEPILKATTTADPQQTAPDPRDQPVVLGEDQPGETLPVFQPTESLEKSDIVAPAHPPEPRPAKPASPAKPSLIQRGFTWVIRFFTEGNPLVRIGALVMFVGVALLLRYLSDRVTVAIEIRLLGIAAGGLAMILTGWRLRLKKPGFSLPFQGAGIGVLYLATYASLRLYQLLPASAVFALMLLVVALTIFLALWQDAMILAALGVVGGFLAPVLASTGQGSHVELFSFYLALNLVIAVVSWFRAWRVLNWLGWVFTFGIASVWGAQYYQPQFLESTEPFLIAHFFLYLAVSVLFASRQPPRLKGFVDGTLVFGTPIVAFTLQAMLLGQTDYGLAWSAAVLGVLYLLLRWLLLRRDPEHFQLLGQSFLALGAGFLTLAIPLAFDARVTSAMWSLEGAAVAWIGIRQSSILRRLSGYALMVVGSFAYLFENTASGDELLFLNADYLGILIIAGVFMLIGRLIKRDLPDTKLPLLAPTFWLWGALWWFAGGLNEIRSHLHGPAELLTAVAFAGLSAVACAEYARAARWRVPQAVAVLLALSLLPILAKLHLGYQTTMFFNPNMAAVTFSCLALVLVGLRQIHANYPAPFRFWGNGLALAATGLWLWAGMMELDAHLARAAATAWSLAWTATSLLGIFTLARPINWPEWRRANEALIGFLVVFLLAFAGQNVPVFQAPGLLVWPLAFVIQYLLLWRRESGQPSHLHAAHAICFWILTATLVYGAQHWFNARLGHGSAIALSAFALIPVILLALIRSKPVTSHWPVSHHLDAYLGPWLWPVMIWLTGWLVVANMSAPPTFAPLPYWPLANVLDLTSILTLISLGLWWRRDPMDMSSGLARIGAGSVGAAGFVWLNASLLRALHFQLPIAWDYYTLWHSFIVQASVTILWSSSAVALMILGARLARRWVWVIGASLMGMAVLKLFVIDTASSGTLARIAAFFGVAIGLFLAGYFVPRPPAREE